MSAHELDPSAPAQVNPVAVTEPVKSAQAVLIPAQRTQLAETGPGESQGHATAPGSRFPSLAELLHGFRRCWLRVLTLGLLCAAGAAAATWFLVPQPKARARTLLEVAPEKPHVAFQADSRVDYLGFKKTQQARVKSRMVLNAALRKPKVAEAQMLRAQPDPVAWLEEHLVVDYSAGPQILTIMLSGDDPQELIEIVNAVARAYLDEIAHIDLMDRAERLESLKDIQSRYEERLRSKRRTLRELAQAAGTSDTANLAVKQRIALDELGATQKELTQLQSDVRKQQVAHALELEKTKALKTQPIPDAFLNEEMAKDPLIRRNQEQLVQLQAELDELKRINPTRYETLSQKQQADLQAVQAAMAERREKLRPILEPQIREQIVQRAQNQESQLRERLLYLQGLEKRLNDDVERLDKESRSLTLHGLDLEELRSQINQADLVLQKVSSEGEVLNVERTAPSQIRLLEEGVVSQPNQRQRQVLASTAAGFSILLLVALGLSWREARSLRILSGEEVVRGLGIRVMGTIPLLPSRTRRAAGVTGLGEAEWQHLFIESVDSLRTMLLHLARVDALQVIMVTSALGGEGKTSLSSHLATSLARAGRKTLLLDCDLRKPSLHSVFSLPEGPGFCDLIRGEALLDDVIQATNVERLWLLQAGACDEVALSELAQDKAPAIFQQLREQFDFVVVDSAPALLVTDSLMLGQAVDGVLLSVLEQVSQLGRVYAAYERLTSLHIRMLGAVVAGKMTSDLYGYDYRYPGRRTRETTVGIPLLGKDS